MKMKRHISIAFLLLTFCLAGPVNGQDNNGGSEPPRGMKRPMADQPRDMRNNMLRRLGLSADQIKQIQRLNQERKPLMNEAQMRFRKANRALDEAIYADAVNNVDVQARLQEVHLAQAEVAQIRYMNELEVRKILTPEQLVRFREMRTRFERTRGRFRDRGDLRGSGPVESRGRNRAPSPVEGGRPDPGADDNDDADPDD